jgi:hypothetical protein
MSSVDKLVDRFSDLMVKLGAPQVNTDPEVAPMPRLPKNRSTFRQDGKLSKIPLRKIHPNRVRWNWDKASRPTFNRSVLEKKRGRGANLTEGLTLPEMGDPLDADMGTQDGIRSP